MFDWSRWSCLLAVTCEGHLEVCGQDVIAAYAIIVLLFLFFSPACWKWPFGGLFFAFFPSNLPTNRV